MASPREHDDPAAVAAGEEEEDDFWAPKATSAGTMVVYGESPSALAKTPAEAQHEPPSGSGLVGNGYHTQAFSKFIDGGRLGPTPQCCGSHSQPSSPTISATTSSAVSAATSAAPCATSATESPAPAPLPSQPVAARVSLSNGAEVIVRECPSSSWEGGSVWPPAHALVQLLDAAEDGVTSKHPGALSRPTLASASVLELGAGCGLSGIAAAHLGARRVVLSDLPVALPTLRANVLANGFQPQAALGSEPGHSSPTIEVTALDWTAASQPLLSNGKTFDLILAAECLYHEDMVLPLLRTAHRACALEGEGRGGGQLLLAGIIGSSAVRAFREIAPRFFAAIDPLTLPGEAQAQPTSRAPHRLSKPLPLVLPPAPLPSNHSARLELLGQYVWPAALCLAEHVMRGGIGGGIGGRVGRGGGGGGGMSVVELGCGGTGLPGIAAALSGGEGTRVLLSDKHEELIRLVNEAIADNGCQDRCKAAVYSWGDAMGAELAFGGARQVGKVLVPRHPLQREGGDEVEVVEEEEEPFGIDLILGADCLYSISTAGAFADALDQLATPPRDFRSREEGDNGGGSRGTSGGTRVLICCEQRWSVGESLEILKDRGWAATALGVPWRVPEAQRGLFHDRILEMGEGTCTVYELHKSEGGAQRPIVC